MGTAPTAAGVDLARAISQLFEQVWSAALGEPLRTASAACDAELAAAAVERFCVSIRGDWCGAVVLSCPRGTATEFAASLLGKCVPDIRLPLVEPGEATRARVKAAMVHAGLLN